MTTIQWQEAILSKTKELPNELLREVYDFAEFLVEKKHRIPTSPKNRLDVLNEAETAHLEEEFLDYKTRFPRE